MEITRPTVTAIVLCLQFQQHRTTGQLNLIGVSPGLKWPKEPKLGVVCGFIGLATKGATGSISVRVEIDVPDSAMRALVAQLSPRPVGPGFPFEFPAIELPFINDCYVVVYHEGVQIACHPLFSSGKPAPD